jgi:23S rRNA (cytidine1920-2'-O)/16S rRNA (cytidine1409-2'-O)-methyltransferase
MLKPDYSANRLRLDEALVNLGHYKSRSRARDAIVRGTILVDGMTILRPSQLVSSVNVIELDDPARGYVSRAALKLIAGLDHFGLSPEGKVALDIGASTGGFVEVLVERGAEHVIGVDVGHGQMERRIAGNRKVTNLEGQNARELDEDHLDGRKIDFVTSDVSFISIKLALPPALDLAEIGAQCVILVKPQFEAGREAIGKGGILKDPTQSMPVARELERWFTEEMGWRSLGLIESPIEGADGNKEYLLGGIKETNGTEDE